MMIEKEWTIEAMEYLMSDGKTRRCSVRSIDVRRVIRAAQERETRSWWQTVTHCFQACLGVFLP